MKELTIEQKAKAYDKAVEKIKYVMEHGVSPVLNKEDLQDIFPQLKESEDERIKNEIIAFVEQSIHRGGGTPIPQEKENRWIAWLEKQGEQIDFANKEYWRGYREGKQEIIDKYAELEKQGKQKLVEKYNIRSIGSKNAQGKLGEMIKEMKSADKIEPKFKVGDWITDGNITIQIETIENNCYLYYGDCALYSTKTADKVYHLWTIEDAKDGDVLAVEPIDNHPSPFIAIYKERGLDYFNSYCFIGFDAKFYTGDTGHDMTGIHPATKEQRDTLMKAMADAGYTFDFENKELKKIEQKPAEWSEDDERLFQIVIDILDRQNHLGNISRTDLIACVRKLKSLRPQPKREWSEEDEVGLANVMWAIKQARTITKDEYDMGNLWRAERWIKSLKDRYTWKPTEEQMKALHDLNLTGGISYAGQGQELINLYNNLKKL